MPEEVETTGGVVGGAGQRGLPGNPCPCLPNPVCRTVPSTTLPVSWVPRAPVQALAGGQRGQPAQVTE